MSTFQANGAAAPRRNHDERLDLLGRLLARDGVAIRPDVDQILVGEAEREEPDAAADIDELLVGDLFVC